MALYFVYEPEERPADPIARADGLVFVKDGFCWPALFVPILWLLFHQMWIELGLFVATMIGIEAVLDLSTIGHALTGWFLLGFFFLFALEANGFRRNFLTRKGYVPAGVAYGRRRDEAEFRFFRDWLPAQTALGDRANKLVKAAAAALSAPVPPSPQPDADDVIGSFPRS